MFFTIYSQCAILQQVAYMVSCGHIHFSKVNTFTTALRRKECKASTQLLHKWHGGTIINSNQLKTKT